MLIQFLILTALIVVSFILSQSTRNLEKLSAYECGLEPLGNARLKIKIVYYIIGILYLLFDLEVIFLYPLAASLYIINSYIGFLIIIIFFILLTLAFIYEWYQGVLELK
jgi:NADH-quinone oxidoreductase subunit A